MVSFPHLSLSNPQNQANRKMNRNTTFVQALIIFKYFTTPCGSNSVLEIMQKHTRFCDSFAADHQF
eukprot:UN02655